MAAPASEESNATSPESSNHIGQQEYAIIHLGPSSDQWKMSKIPTDQVYKVKMLSGVNFLNDYKIKTAKGTFPLGSTETNLFLIDQKTIQKYQRKYRFLHVGLVQISIRVLTRLGSNSSITIYLKDGRPTNLKNSILVAFKTNVSSDNLICFNFYPNVSYCLDRLKESQSLILSMSPKECEVRDDVMAFSLTCRVCYKFMKTDLDPKSVILRPKLELNTQESSILVPVVDGDRVFFRARENDEFENNVNALILSI